MRRLGLILLIVALGLAALFFSALNTRPVEIELAFAKISGPLGVIIVGVLVVGLLIGIAVRGAWVANLLAERGRLRRALRVAEARARASVASREHGV